MRKIKKTAYHSWLIGSLSRGCRLCVSGHKSVLFITGLCAAHCYYCPISDQKKNKDVIYINEWPTFDIKNIIEEIKLCSSKGVGITGGDPLVKIDRVCDFIKTLKKEFGKKFHIHLYTPLNLVSKSSLNCLYKAGLDEIRFHPSVVGSRKEWSVIGLAKNFGWDIGVEIPVIPGKEGITKRLLSFLDKIGIDFLNLNELEVSDTNSNDLLSRGFVTKNKLSYGVKGSEELALRLLKYCESNNYYFNAHYCTAKLKDKVQLAKRIKNRARNVAQPFDKVNSQGMLIRGVIYSEQIFPGFDYNNRLNKITPTEKNKITAGLTKLKEFLINKHNIKHIFLDKNKLRLLCSSTAIKNIADNVKRLGYKPAIVEEYPTYDSFIVYVDYL